MSSQRYQEFIAERTRLLERIRELETENAELRKRLVEPVNPVPPASSAMQNLSLQEKIDLFCSLFKGRDDVFARRWYSKTSGKAGYQPVCQNEWTPLCDKRKYKCADCPNRQFSPLTYNDYYRHLEGKDSDGRDVIGLYVLNEDNTCHLLCTDFDDKNCEHGYQDDVLAFVDVCRSWNVPYSIERSRSGNGAHVWIFFDWHELKVAGTCRLFVSFGRCLEVSRKYMVTKKRPSCESLSDVIWSCITTLFNTSGYRLSPYTAGSE